MAQIKRFLECLVPVTLCNLECPYCYIIQENRRNMKLAEMPYSPEHIAQALRPERLGGTCYISICGAGETMAQTEVVPITALLLKQGHFVNITTNGTLSRRFDDLIEACGENIRHLHVAFSFHYTELKKRGWLDTFFDNILKMKNAGASILLQLNLCDEYVPYIEEIKAISMERLGAWPQVALTRNETTEPFGIFTEGTEEEYKRNAEKFDSPLFDFTYQNFRKERKEFCYAGDWSATVNLQTGVMTKCYEKWAGVNIFEDVNAPIPFEAVGKQCKNRYCVNSSHFMSLGVIPSLETPTYAQLRNRAEAHWYTPEMEEFLSGRLKDSNSTLKPKLRYYGRAFYEKSGLHSLLHRVYWGYYDRRGAYREKKWMEETKRSLQSPPGKKVYMIGTPLHENLGDSAIVLAQKAFLQRCGWPEERIVEIAEDLYLHHWDQIRQWIPEDAMIAQLGGGHMGNQWPDEELLHRRQVEAFPNQPNVIFPQTLYYMPGEEGEKSKTESIPIYNGKKNLTLTARERYSYETMKSLYPDTQVLLAPDIVLSATMDTFGAKPQERDGILLCLRNDPERVMGQEEHQALKTLLDKLGLKTSVTDMYAERWIAKEERGDQVRRKMEELASARLVITDRLHGMVFCALTGTPCIVFTNNNHKVRGTYEWISYLPYIRYVETVAEVEDLLPELLNMENCTFDNGPLKPCYEKLEEVVSNYANH